MFRIIIFILAIAVGSVSTLDDAILSILGQEVDVSVKPPPLPVVLAAPTTTQPAVTTDLPITTTNEPVTTAFVTQIVQQEFGSTTEVAATTLKLATTVPPESTTKLRPSLMTTVKAKEAAETTVPAAATTAMKAIVSTMKVATTVKLVTTARPKSTAKLPPLTTKAKNTATTAKKATAKPTRKLSVITTKAIATTRHRPTTVGKVTTVVAKTTLLEANLTTTKAVPITTVVTQDDNSTVARVRQLAPPTSAADNFTTPIKLSFDCRRSDHGCLPAGGSCNDSNGRCTCKQNVRGFACDISGPAMVPITMCNNGLGCGGNTENVCTRISETGYSCSCAYGWYGETCQKPRVSVSCNSPYMTVDVNPYNIKQAFGGKLYVVNIMKKTAMTNAACQFTNATKQNFTLRLTYLDIIVKCGGQSLDNSTSLQVIIQSDPSKSTYYDQYFTASCPHVMSNEVLKSIKVQDDSSGSTRVQFSPKNFVMIILALISLLF